MSHLYESLHPDDLPPYSQGEPVIDEEPEQDENEGADDDEQRD